MLDFSFKTKLKPQKGRILISDPFQSDEYFQRSVVYLCEHSNQGTFGFVLNNLVDINLNQMHPSFPNIAIEMSIGGPVETESMYFIHTLGNELKQSILVDKNICMGGDFRQLYSFITLEHIQANQIKFFLGYSGWSPGQLEEEINRNAWVVAEIEDSFDVMNNQSADAWNQFMKKMGQKFNIMTNFPLDPNDN